MIDGPREFLVVPAKTRAELLGVNACALRIVQLLRKVRDAEYINGRLRKNTAHSLLENCVLLPHRQTSSSARYPSR